MSIKVESANISIDEKTLAENRKSAAEAFETLKAGTLNMTGWVTLPDEITDEKFDALNAAADKIKSDSDTYDRLETQVKDYDKYCDYCYR